MTSPEQKLDYVLSLHPKHNELFVHTLDGICAWGRPSRVYVITQRKNFDFIEGLKPRFLARGMAISLVDEDELVPGMTFEAVRVIIEKAGAAVWITGWYFQQFLKMAFSLHAECRENYVIWDSDTILLRPIQLIDREGRYLMQPSNEFHAPNFRTMDRLLGLKQMRDYSFISEHMAINSEVMRSMIADIQQRFPNGNWWQSILACIPPEDVPRNAFSEFETYATYVLSKNPELIKVRNLHSTRRGVPLCAGLPSTLDLWTLALRYTYATFEMHHPRKGRLTFIWRPLVILLLPVTLVMRCVRGALAK